MKKLLALSATALTAAALVAPSFANAASLNQQFGTVHGVIGGQRVLGENVQSYGLNGDYNYRVFNDYGWYVGAEGFFNYGRQNSVNYYNYGVGAKTKYLWETATDFTPYAGLAIGYQQTRASDEFSKHTGGVYGALEVGSLYGQHFDFGLRVQTASLSKGFADSASRAQYTYALYAGVKF
ncbi:hypothetical protein CJP74_00275 [Psittacicella melopsittaci]|uniref:Outer membrane protein beta-barrel domain-containing protein n=1 Tax=Psittacicella melopsittaci TaxID=2028576 RepID=A0A3A1YA14_9GAMM|nr:hypothetical protein [Psittacicella melopsittaci]RIY34050.1 hypothetical protein CJP74_00275 [Psittacicella melopsittaci]